MEEARKASIVSEMQWCGFVIVDYYENNVLEML
jgi:hypothetical protein